MPCLEICSELGSTGHDGGGVVQPSQGQVFSWVRVTGLDHPLDVSAFVQVL